MGNGIIIIIYRKHTSSGELGGWEPYIAKYLQNGHKILEIEIPRPLALCCSGCISIWITFQHAYELSMNRNQFASKGP